MLSAFSFLVAGGPVKVCVVGPVSLLLTSSSAAWSMIVVPSLKDCEAEKAKVLDPDVVLTVPDRDIKLRALDAAMFYLFLQQE